jgi:hypothetical protein
MLLMALERRDGDEKSLETVRALRRRGIDGVARLLVAAGLVEADDDEATARDFAQLAVACFDGAFAAAQLDGEDTDLQRMLQLLQRALLALSRPCEHANTDS